MITEIQSIIGGWIFKVIRDDGQEFGGTSTNWSHMSGTIELLATGQINDQVAITLDPSEYNVVIHEKSC